MTKAEIIGFCRGMGADLVGFAPVRRWEERREVPPDFYPQALWPLARTVVVLGVQMPLPMVDTTPSALHLELYRTANRALDDMAFRLTRFLYGRGFPAYFFPRDGYGSMKALRERPLAAFSHVFAACYAGLGTVGANNVVLTREYGPRVRWVSVFTSLQLEPDPLLEKDLCIRCGLCARACPVQALALREDRVVGDFDKAACLARAEELVRRRVYPCGICTKVCPVGKDREVYQEKGLARRYREEREVLSAHPDHPAYRSWQHVRTYGTAEPEFGARRRDGRAAERTGGHEDSRANGG